MIVSGKKNQEFYNALLRKDPEYEGVFYVGVKTTGIFCRPTCPARKPKFENCEFFSSAKDALIASFKPCKRCKPMENFSGMSENVQKILDAIESNPEHRWKSQDFRELSIHIGTARRQFQKMFGMTFIQYARARRVGMAINEIRNGSSVINAQLSAGYESSSGFRDAFTRIMGTSPAKSKDKILYAHYFDSPLGPMLAIADDKKLYLLEFVERRGLETEIARLRSRLKTRILPGETAVIFSIKNEIQEYFAGKNFIFKTPICMIGSEFQKKVWHKLTEIPTGQTWSYAQLAGSIGKPTAYRAVANANGANQFAIIVPCHRVINTNGELGGYGGGIERKKWLLEHERKHYG